MPRYTVRGSDRQDALSLAKPFSVTLDAPTPRDAQAEARRTREGRQDVLIQDVELAS